MKFKKMNEYHLEVTITFEELHKRGLVLVDSTLPEEQHDLMNYIMHEIDQHSAFDLSAPFAVTNMDISPQDVRITFHFSSPASLEESMSIEDLFSDAEPYDPEKEENPFQTVNQQGTEFVLCFQSIEDVISMTENINPFILFELQSRLYSYQNKYLLHVHFFAEQTEGEIQDSLSTMKEFSHLTQMTHHFLDEYANTIVEEDAIEEIYKQFVNPKGMPFSSQTEPFIMVVPMMRHSQQEEPDLIDVLVDETVSPSISEVYFESQTDNPDLSFSVFFDLSTQKITGRGSRKFRDFILNMVYPFYLQEKEPFES